MYEGVFKQPILTVKCARDICRYGWMNLSFINMDIHRILNTNVYCIL